MITFMSSITARLKLSLAMTLLYIVALGCQLTGAMAHEWIGLAFCSLCVLHMVVNWRWFNAIFRGRYTFLRYVNTALNLLLLITVAVLCVAGSLSSRHVFGFLEFKGGIDIRQVHTFAAYWGLVLFGIHIGLQWVKVLTGLRRTPTILSLVSMNGTRLGLLFLVFVYGVWASFDRAMGEKLFQGFSFDFWDPVRPTLFFYTHNLAILALYVLVTHYFCKIVVKNMTISHSVPLLHKQSSHKEIL